MRGEYSLADIRAVTEGNNSGFGGDNWAWIIVLFLIFGYGRNGSGFGGNGGGGASDNYVLASDFATIQRQLSDGFGGVEKGLDTIRNGLCDGFYTEAQLINGVNTNILNTGFNLQTAINGVGTQLQQCCCDLRYENAQNTCAITNAINYGIRDVMQNCNNNYRMLHDEIVANKLESKNDQINALQMKLNNAELRASQEAQSNYLYTAITDKLSPCPRPAYLTCNPNAPINYSINYGSGCGCGY